MSRGENTPGVSELTRVIREAARGMATGASGADFGEIAKDLSLMVNGFSVPIPKSDYLICRMASGQSGGTKVKAGDRVLVLWAGNDAVIVDRIVEASEVL